MNAWLTRPATLFVAVFAAAILTACDSDDKIDHDPPSGKGSIVVDNRTSSDTYVFVNGKEYEKTRDRDWKAYDFDPGIYRVVLDERDGDRNFRDDVDVLDDKLTVIEITSDPYHRDRYDTYIYFK